MLGVDGNVSTYDPVTSIVTPITTDAGPGRVYSQPTWSPDGTRLAFVENTAPVSGIQAASGIRRVGLSAQQAVPGSVHIAPVTGGDTAVVTTPFSPFYLYWSPDGSQLAFLGNDPVHRSPGLRHHRYCRQPGRTGRRRTALLLRLVTPVRPPARTRRQ